MAIIYGVIALILSLLTLNYYRNKSRKNRLRKKKNEDSGTGSNSLSNCGDVDCFDMNIKDGWDCIDIECGKIECIEVDCGGLECGGFDCNCN